MSNKLSQKARQEQLARIDNDMLVGSLGILSDVLDFANIDPESEEPPMEWIKKLGKEEAWKKFRLAKAGWATSRNLPSGVKVASTIVIEVMKAKLNPPVPAYAKPPLRKPKEATAGGVTDVEKFGEVNVDD